MVYLTRPAAADFRNQNFLAQVRGDFDAEMDTLVPPAPAPVTPSFDLGNDGAGTFTPPDMAASPPAVLPQPEPSASSPSLPVVTGGASLGQSLADQGVSLGPSAPTAAPPAPIQGTDWQKLAYDQLNKPYIWGSQSGAGGRGTGDIDPSTGLPRGFDCSGYVSWVFKNGLGIDLPAFTGSAYTKTQSVDLKDARPGDVVFYNMNNPDPAIQHMAIYLGDGKIIQAGGTGRNVNIASVYSVGTPEFRRPSGAGAASVPKATAYAASLAEERNPQESWQAQFNGMLDGALNEAGAAKDNAISTVGQAKDAAAQQVTDWGAEFTRMLDGALKDAGAGATPQPMSTAVIGDDVPSYIREYAQQNGSQVAENPYVGVKPEPRDTQSPLDVLGQVKDIVATPGSLLPNVAEDVKKSGLWGPSDEEYRLGQQGAAKVLLSGEKMTPEEQTAFDKGQSYVGGMTSPVSTPKGFNAGSVIDGFIQKFDDRNIGLRRFEQDTAKLIGRELVTDERPSVLTRLAADPAAKVIIDEGLKPAIQSVRSLGDQGFDDLSELIVSRNNVDVASALGQKVTKAVMDAPMRVARDGDLAKAKSSLQMRERMWTAAQAGGDDATQKIAQRNLQLAQRRVDRLTQIVEDNRQAALKQRADEAAYAGGQAASQRQFSGGVNAAQSEAAVARLEQNPTVKAAADQVSTYVQSLRDRLVKAGVWSQEFADQMAKQYPNWVPTRILDYMSDSAGQRVGAKGLSLRDRGLRRYTEEGTARLAQNPIEALVDYTFQVERMARKNEAFQAFRNADFQRPMDQRVLRKVNESYKPLADEATFEGWVNGEKIRYVAPKAIAESINGAGVTPVPEWAGRYGDFVRAAVTQRNPVFLAGNTALDIPEYLLTSYTAEGGNPLAVPKILWELAKGYGRALTPRDIARGEWTGSAAEFMKSGGGQSGMYQIGNKAAKQTVESLRKPNVFNVGSKRDILKLFGGENMKKALSLKPVEAIGERLEQGPRIAAYNLAKKRGEGTVGAAIRGREATIDFARGGEVTKYINQFVPFFNVVFQGPSKVARTFGNNPVAASLAVGQLIGIPTVMAEAWNNADPQRAEDYKNVSDYYKRTGVVIMLDGTTDAEGNRVPQFVHINLRNWAGLAQIARQAAAMAGLGEPREWSKLLLETASSMSPIGGSNAADFANSLTTMVPGLGTSAQLSQDRDFFRNTQIATKANDERAGGTARAIADTINTVRAPYTAERVRPSQVDFAIKDLVPGLGATALSAGDMVLGGPKDKRQTPGDIPVVGGLIGRFVKAGGNQELYDAREQVITPTAKQALEHAGVADYNPSPVGDKAYTADLTNTEQTRWQQVANVYVNEAILNLVQNEKFLALPPDQRREAVISVIGQARETAKDEVVQGLTRDLPRPSGQPAKYQGVTDYKREIEIDNAISAVNAWEANRRRGERPSAEEMQLARRYEGRISPQYTRWQRGERDQSREIRRMGAPPPGGLAPVPTR